MGATEEHIIRTALEFDRTNDWPQGFFAFTPPGGDEDETRAAIEAMEHSHRLVVAHFDDGPDQADVVLGLGPALADRHA
jgi:hypothetical protein